MKWFFELGNRYAQKSDWKDFALTKFCLCAMGILIGLHIPAKHQKTAKVAACTVFLLTYFPLMCKIFKIAGNMVSERSEA